MIKIWQEPEIKILAQTSFLNPGAGWQVNDPDEFNTGLDVIGEVAGRVCYLSYGKGRKANREYLANIISQEHESVLEHASVTFGIRGISRSLSHEMVRHRHLSFSQLSQRYVEEVEFVRPPNLPFDKVDSFYQFCSGTMLDYKALLFGIQPTLSKKQRLEMARAVLPNCTATQLVVTGNLRAWRHFVKVRGSGAAEAEIHRLAIRLFYQLEFAAPHSMQGLEVKDNEIRTVGIVSSSRSDNPDSVSSNS